MSPRWTLPETEVGYLMRGEFNVVWSCDVCQAQRPADLPAIAAKFGDGYRLANVRAPCPLPGCPGQVKFYRKNGLWPFSLDTIDHTHDAYWERSKQRYAQMTALGWRLECGRWTPPRSSADR